MRNLYRIFSVIILLNFMFITASAQKLPGEWKLVEARQNGVKVPLGREIKTNLIFGDKNRLTGNAGCNRYSTVYRLENKSRIKFQPIVSTRMACVDDNFMKQENTFFSVMEKIEKYKIKGNQLIFFDSNERNVLRFARVPHLNP